VFLIITAMADNNNQRNAEGRRTGGRAATAPPALNPLVPTLTQPAKSLVEKGLIARLSAVFEPTGTKVTGRPGGKLIGDDFDANTDYGIGVLIDRARSLGLVGQKKTSAGPAQPLPSKSLCKRDFEAEKQPRLQQRCNEVASNCGGGPLVGRVRSAGRFQNDHTQSYSDWWAEATPEDRLLSLSDVRGRKGVTPEETAAMANIQCPFRGTLDFVVAEEEDEGSGPEGQEA